MTLLCPGFRTLTEQTEHLQFSGKAVLWLEDLFAKRISHGSNSTVVTVEDQLYEKEKREELIYGQLLEANQTRCDSEFST